MSDEQKYPLIKREESELAVSRTNDLLAATDKILAESEIEILFKKSCLNCQKSVPILSTRIGICLACGEKFNGLGFSDLDEAAQRQIDNAVALKRKGEYGKSIEIYERLNLLYPNNPYFYKAYAKTLTSSGDYDLGLEHFIKAKKLYEFFEEPEWNCEEFIESLLHAPRDSEEFLIFLKGISGSQNYEINSDLVNDHIMQPDEMRLQSFTELAEIYEKICNLPVTLEAYLVFDLVIEDAYAVIASSSSRGSGLNVGNRNIVDFREYVESLNPPKDFIKLEGILGQFLDKKKRDALPVGCIARRGAIGFSEKDLNKFITKYANDYDKYSPLTNKSFVYNYKNYLQSHGLSYYHKIVRVYAIDCLSVEPLESFLGETKYDKFLRVFIVDVLRLDKNITIGEFYKKMDELSTPVK